MTQNNQAQIIGVHKFSVVQRSGQLQAVALVRSDTVRESLLRYNPINKVRIINHIKRAAHRGVIDLMRTAATPTYAAILTTTCCT